MMTKPTVEDLLQKSVNRYELVNAISKRARQIVNGDSPKIETKEDSKNNNICIGIRARAL